MYFTELSGPVGLKVGEGKDGCPCRTGQPRAEQNAGLSDLLERAVLCGHHALFEGIWGAAASAAHPTSILWRGALQAGGKRSQVSQFPVSAGSYLPEKSQAKDLATSFPTQGRGRERRISPTPPLHLQWAVDLPFLTGKVVYYWVVRKSLESSVTGMNCQRVGCEEILKRWLLGGSSHYVFVLVPHVLFKNF